MLLFVMLLFVVLLFVMFLLCLFLVFSTFLFCSTTTSLFTPGSRSMRRALGRRVSSLQSSWPLLWLGRSLLRTFRLPQPVPWLQGFEHSLTTLCAASVKGLTLSAASRLTLPSQRIYVPPRGRFSKHLGQCLRPLCPRRAKSAVPLMKFLELLMCIAPNCSPVIL